MVKIQFKSEYMETEEVATILRAIADRIENGETAKQVRDGNGNKVGQWEMTPVDLDD